MIIVKGSMQLAQGGVALLRSAIPPLVSATRTEPGCDHYDMAVDVEAPDRLQISERWIDQEALGAHLVSDHVVAFQVAMRRTRVLKADVNIHYPDGTIKRLINV